MLHSAFTVSRPRWVTRATVRLALAALISACGSAESSTGTTVQVTSVAGTWVLTSVNGSALPFSITSPGVRTDIMSRQFVNAADGTFTYTSSQKATDTEDGTVTTQNRTDSGTYTLADAVVTYSFRSDGSTQSAGVTSSSTMQIFSGAYTLLFTKR